MKSKQTETKFASVLRLARHLFTSRMFGSVFLGLILMSGSAWAATSAIEGIVKDSINNVKTKLGDPTKLNFALKVSATSLALPSARKKATHMVWMPSETGT